MSAGSLSDAAIFSFYPSKNLGAMGDGGAIVTNNDELASWVRSARSYGSKAKNQHVMRGVNSRLDNMQAAVLRAKLCYLDEWNDTRRWLAAQYGELLEGVPGLVLPTERENTEPVYHLFVIRCEPRDALLVHLRQQGINAAVHYPVPLHRQGALDRACLIPDHLTHSEAFCDHLLSLPLCPYTTLNDVENVAYEVRTGLAQLASTQRPGTTTLHAHRAPSASAR